MMNQHLSQLRTRVIDFFHAPQSPKPLGCFRLAIAGFTLLQALIWYSDWLSFFDSEGWLQWEISRALNFEWNLHIKYIYKLLEPFGASSGQAVMIFYWLYITSA